MIDLIKGTEYHSELYYGEQLVWKRPIAPNLFKGTKSFDYPIWANGYNPTHGNPVVEDFELDSEFKQARITASPNANSLGTLMSNHGFSFYDTETTFVVSAWFKAEEPNQTIGITLSANHIAWQQKNLPHNEWIRLRWVFKGTGLSLQTFRFENQNLKGNVWCAKVKVETVYPYATDWCPSADEGVLVIPELYPEESEV